MRRFRVKGVLEGIISCMGYTGFRDLGGWGVI